MGHAVEAIDAITIKTTHLVRVKFYLQLKRCIEREAVMRSTSTKDNPDS